MRADSVSRHNRAAIEAAHVGAVVLDANVVCHPALAIERLAALLARSRQAQWILCCRTRERSRARAPRFHDALRSVIRFVINKGSPLRGSPAPTFSAADN